MTKPNKPTSIEEIVDTYPTELAMKVTEIVLNKEPNWSRRLEQLLTYELQETKKAEREALVEPVAKAIYDQMSYYEDGAKPKWVVGGNSLKQDEARRIALQALTKDN